MLYFIYFHVSFFNRRKYQSYGQVTSLSDDRSLADAKRKGEMHEALLERRVKTKSDKFC